MRNKLTVMESFRIRIYHYMAVLLHFLKSLFIRAAKMQKLKNMPILVSTLFISFILLANVNSRSRLLYAVARPSVVCRLSVTLVHPTQAVEIFGNISRPFGTLAIL